MSDRKSIRIDTEAYSLLKQKSEDWYDSTQAMSKIATDAVRYRYDPQPQQRALRVHFSDDNVDSHNYDESGDTAVLHWVAPSELIQLIESNAVYSLKEEIEECIYQYIHALESSQGIFENPAISETGDRIEWDAVKDNYDIEDFDFDQLDETQIKKSYHYRLPLVYYYLRNMWSMDQITYAAFKTSIKAQFYDRYTDVSDKTIRNDFSKLVEKDLFVESIGGKSNNLVVDWDSVYYIRTQLGEYVTRLDALLEHIDESVDDVEPHSETFTQLDNTLTLIAQHDIDELQDQSERATEIHKRLANQVVNRGDRV